MAKAKKLPSGNYRAQVYDYTDLNGKRHYRSFTSKTKKDAEMQAAIFSATKIKDNNNSVLTFGEAMDKYIAQREPMLSPSTVREYLRTASTDYKNIRSIPINKLTNDILQQHSNSFSMTHSPKSVRNNMGLVTAVLKRYRPEFAVNVRLPQKEQPVLYIPSDADIKKIMSSAHGTEMELPILLAAFGPMRRGEISALSCEDISGARVHVRHSMVKDKNKQWVIKAPKTVAGDRFIDYPDFVAEKWQGKTGMITDLTPHMISSRFEHILKRAEVPKFRFHDLRHYCASIMHAIGVPNAYIMSRGGWNTETTLNNIYRHALDDKMKEMSNKTNSYFNKMQHEISHEFQNPQ